MSIKPEPFVRRAAALVLCLPLLAAAAPPRAGTPGTIELTTQPGSALEATAVKLTAADLRQSQKAGDRR